MVKYHQKSIAAPKSWPLIRKKNMFTVRALPSGHQKQYALPMALFMKEVIKCAHTQKEVKYILHKKQVLINGRRIRDEKNAVGLFDVVEIPELKECYRVFLDRHGLLCAVAIAEKEKNISLMRVCGKTDRGKNTCQLNGDDGRNILVPKKEAAAYHCGDSILVDRAEKKITHLPRVNGCPLYFIGGKAMGTCAPMTGIRKENIQFSTAKGPAETAKQYAVVVGKEKPVITLPEGTSYE